MNFPKAKKIFLSIILFQITSGLVLMFFVDMPSGFSSLDIRRYDRSQVILDSNKKIINASLTPSDEWCVPISLDKTGIWTKDVTIALEDRRFYSHHGFDAIAIGRAIISNILSRRTVSGASTITSQLIRIAIPRERTMYAKVLEFWSAFRLEKILSKDEILELYLNRAPFGGNIRGIEAASNAYFNKSAESLSLGESVTLISILRSPSRFRPDRFPDKARALRDDRLDYLAARGVISTEHLALAKSETLPGARYPLPSNASMAAMHIREQGEEKSVIESAIDSSLQLLLERNMSDALSQFPPNITGAGIIVENSTGFVRAYVGNARHGSSLPDAQVDCGASLRSPGSTLKPFIYAAAFDMGLITPASLIADTPLAFRGNAPRNFDMSYRGPVSVRNALASSLNAPAVRVLRMVGYPTAKAVLNRFGFTHIDKDPQYYTDSLILGGCEATLIELATAYRALASGGLYSRLRWIYDAPLSDKRVLSSEASYLTTNILQDERRLVPIYQEISQKKDMFIAFKTGTSYGLRDAWTAGYSKNYTVAVWIGSPPGMGNSSLVGMQAAAPAFLKIIRDIWRDSEKPIEKPSGVYRRTVCSLSGDAPNKYCPQTVSDLAIRDISKIKLCSIHRNIDGRTIVYWPPSLRAWMQRDTDITAAVKNIKIIRPATGHIIILQNNNDSASIFLSAEGDYPHYWYIDGKFIGICRNAEGLFANVQAGNHKASVLSGNNSDSVSFEVKTPKEIKDSSVNWSKNIIN
jgi:penicillin-binding protein 1C